MAAASDLAGAPAPAPAAPAPVADTDLSDVGVGSVRQQIVNLVRESLAAIVPTLDGIEPQVALCGNPKNGDYQCNNAMGIWSRIKGPNAPFRNPNAVGQALASSIPQSSVMENVSVAGPGFVNITLSDRWIEKKLHQLLSQGIGAWAPVLKYNRVVIDFSSPNIAKEMHVGHLRSTIIGESLCRMMEYCGVDVLRRNHVGDWGTQFGMLIEYLFEQFPNWEDIGEQAVGDLQDFYKRAKVKFDEDAAFKEKAQKAVVLLQGGDPNYRAAWTKICDVSRRSFDQVYERLNVTIEERGESYYNEYIPRVVKILEEKGLVEDSEGARVITVSGQKIPLILVKRDGGFNYASTDMTAMWYRLNEEKAEAVIYVTDVGQSQHFDMVFKAAKRAGWLPESESEIPQAKHVGFGLVLGADGKRFRTRSTEVVRLVDLLDEAKDRSKQGLVERGREGEWSAQELEEASEALGYGAIKYADLKNNRLTNYTFNFDQMLDIRGNTAVYLLYAHARICSIIRKSGKDIEVVKTTGRLQLVHASERALGLQLIRFGEVVEDAATDLLPNVLCEYLYTLSGMFTDFYTNCKVVGSEEEASRLLLCEATAMTMRECFKLLGIKALYRL
jgi:arginyl-tRNA synthetase